MSDRNLWLANLIRDEMNETLASYDVPSSVYEQDVLIDASCVCLADKALACAEKAEAERDGLREALSCYERLVADCNRYGPEGAAARNVLAKDTGSLARQALTALRNGEGEG